MKKMIKALIRSKYYFFGLIVMGHHTHINLNLITMF